MSAPLYPNPKNWYEWLTNLWAKEPVRIVVEGPLGDTSAYLEQKQADGRWGTEAAWAGALDFDAAMDALWDEYERNQEAGAGKEAER